MAKRKNAAAPQPALSDGEPMFRHPGFLLRRAQQIAVSSFVEHYGKYGITSTQTGILKVVQRWPGIDQVGVGRILGLDRTTATTSVTTLAGEKLIDRRSDPLDGRRRALYITAKGEKLVKQLGDMLESRNAMLGIFSKSDASTFMRLLEHFVVSSNESIRVPMETSAPRTARLR